MTRIIITALIATTGTAGVAGPSVCNFTGNDETGMIRLYADTNGLHHVFVEMDDTGHGAIPWLFDCGKNGCFEGDRFQVVIDNHKAPISMAMYTVMDSGDNLLEIFKITNCE